MRFPAALPAIALAAGISFGIFFPVARVPALFTAASYWLIALWALALRFDRVFLWDIAMGFFAVGLTLGAQSDAAAQHTPLEALFDRHLPPHEYQLFANIEGRLRSDAGRSSGGGVTLSVDVDRIEFEGGHRSTSGGAIIGVGGELGSNRLAEWRAGRRIRISATLRRTAKYLDPGVPNSQRELSWRGTSLVGTTKSDTLVEVLARGDALSEALAAARADIRSAVSASVAPWSERSAAVVTAILIGDRAGLDDEMQRRLQEAGTYHVIAISGGNIAILAGLCVMLLRLLHIGPRRSAIVIAATLIAYALVVGSGSSVWRATLMAVIYFMAQLGDHRAQAGNVAAVSAAILFWFDPLEVVDPGFALTFGATLGLICGMPRLKRSAGMPAWLFAPAALLAASVCAEVALLPVSALVFSRVTAAGLLLNFAAIPLMTVVQIGGMVAVALAHLSVRVGIWAGWVAHVGVNGLLASASLVEFMPWLVRRVPPPSLWVIVLYYGALAAALATRGRTRGWCVAIVAACGWWIVTGPVPATSLQQPLRVTFIDVGQGDAAIVQFPNGRSLSVDAGGLAGTTFDIGGRVVSPTLWALGVRRLDYMSISHGDPDHIGGAPTVFRDFRPLEVWDGVPVPPHEPTRKLRDLADSAGAVWRTLQPNDRVSFGDVTLRVHHPSAPDWERQRVRNDDSEVMEITYGGVSFVFTGDIGRDVERDIAPGFTRVPVRILKVPHHGSATSSSPEFLRALHPDIAVISAGRGNPYGHPVPAVLSRYRDLGAAIYRTDLDGAVTIETDGHTVRLRTYTNRRLTLTTRGR